jgi:hypothetical protein
LIPSESFENIKKMRLEELERKNIESALNILYKNEIKL